LPDIVGSCGRLAQLGERRVRNAEVRSSILLPSTTFLPSSLAGPLVRPYTGVVQFRDSRSRLRIGSAVLAAMVTAVAAHSQPAPSVGDIVRKVQARYDAVGDFEGQFTQTYEGGVLKAKTLERGTVVIKRPGKMRWVYTVPERKEFVSDGAKVYAYFPLDRQVMVSPAPTGSDTTPALFLTGRANLVRDFEAAPFAVPGAPTGLLGVKLVARRADPDFEWLAIAVDPVSYQILHLVAQDRQGGRSIFGFSNLKENRRPPDSTFVFRVPKGVDVIEP
jgi:outer membrane lipoprotein carrier protein